ncbi:MAG TPA: DNA-directed RNA polymerase subunit alpha C-terminal domain-containing protein [bacterium]|nr:DNA-directed RNA polymerase subunit alpha C-terminal domain-containing protein [bacterium]HPT30146.1 DNA-directed RNA polymerase subunit alpha C-terminal domain-containing protein [bacterium]
MPQPSRRRLRKKTPKIDLASLNSPIATVGLSISLTFSLKKLGIETLAELYQQLQQKQISRETIGSRGWQEIKRIFKEAPINQ